MEEAEGGGIPLHLRMPGWSTDAALTVNGEPAPVSAAGTYAVIDRQWAAGDVVVLDLPMPVRMLRAHRLAEEATNQVAVQRGPSSTPWRVRTCPTACASSRPRCAAGPR